MRTFFWMAMVAALGVAGCTSGDGGGGGGAGGEGGAGGAGSAGGGGSADACADIVGKSFASVEQHECGLGQSGPVMCNWQISFSLDASGALTYTWQHSDVGDSGPVTCQDGALTSAVGVSGQPPYTGTYDPATQALVWDGIDYQLAPQ